MRLAVVLVAVALAACATPASDDASAATESEKVCKRITATDSNMPQRICRTKEEWTALDKQGQQGVQDFERARDEINSVGQ
jgi:hypothetical protein